MSSIVTIGAPVLGKNTYYLPQNPVGFPSSCRLFGHAEEFFGEVGHGDERLEFRGECDVKPRQREIVVTVMGE